MLYIPAKIVFTLTAVIGLVYSFRYVLTMRFWFDLGGKIYKTGLLYDQFANVWAAEILNDVNVQKGGHLYGHQDDTISDITGRNERDNSLTRFGWKFTRFLDVLGKNHSIESIED